MLGKLGEELPKRVLLGEGVLNGLFESSKGFRAGAGSG